MSFRNICIWNAIAVGEQKLCPLWVLSTSRMYVCMHFRFPFFARQTVSFPVGLLFCAEWPWVCVFSLFILCLYKGISLFVDQNKDFLVKKRLWIFFTNILPTAYMVYGIRTSLATSSCIRIRNMSQSLCPSCFPFPGQSIKLINIK